MSSAARRQPMRPGRSTATSTASRRRLGRGVEHRGRAVVAGRLAATRRSAGAAVEPHGLLRDEARTLRRVRVGQRHAGRTPASCSPTRRCWRAPTTRGPQRVEHARRCRSAATCACSCRAPTTLQLAEVEVFGGRRQPRAGLGPAAEPGAGTGARDGGGASRRARRPGRRGGDVHGDGPAAGHDDRRDDGCDHGYAATARATTRVTLRRRTRGARARTAADDRCGRAAAGGGIRSRRARWWRRQTVTSTAQSNVTGELPVELRRRDADTAFLSTPAMTYTYATPGVVHGDADGPQRRRRTTSTQTFVQPVDGGVPPGRRARRQRWRSSARTGCNRLWVVNPDNDTVAVFDAGSRTRIAEIAVGSAPRAWRSRRTGGSG